MDGKKLQPIIVKRIKKSAHAPHGGAWKIAYADFVTAMMAFFLLMWLLGSTSRGELNGIADYFNNPVKVTLMGGNGTGNSDSILPGGGRDLSQTSGQVAGGEAERAARLMGAQMARAELARKEAQRIDALEKKITEVIAQNASIAEYGSQIRLEKTGDGLQIQIMDTQNRPMFDVGSALVKPHMREILREIGAAIGDMDNRIALSGHTDATPYGSGERGYSNWELSADRANASRRELVAGGMADDKLVRVEGLASSRLFDEANPTAAANRRISIMVLTSEAEQRLLPMAAPTTVPLPTPEPVPETAPGALPVTAPGAPPLPLTGPEAAGGLQISPDTPKTLAQAGG
ncbi:flagellar motor protein MotB [Hydrogenophaga taeniospiralis]|uniref:flagellar motor protein MotB n=1 Tax=Hydrogenophaga taeniospiralis TaxID=65656 RepID=UPI001CFBFB30|nr:flagellar motor protein MotB [Hydrogenophaga taeniospiralis]MCB4366806.1 flagellar motor protein MotB [Hydrogenophaga taeniospiralis]